jgi:CubicO group peptidase (beta-lactamase class C family)
MFALESPEAFDTFAGECLEAVLGDQTKTASPPRMAVGIVIDGAVRMFHGKGAGVNTRFRIASMTKSFTAAAVLQLRDRGVWRLDDPLSRWVPETLGLKGPTTDSPAITLRHLLTMTGGMSTDDPWGDRQLDLDASGFRELMTSSTTFAVVPGTTMQYSNYGYALLGEAISRATRQSPQRYITHEILFPLGMTATTWDTPNGMDFAEPTHRRDGLSELPPLDDGAFAPMGGLWSTVTDLAAWVHFFVDSFPSRDGADSSVLCRASRREMQQVHTSSPPKVTDTPFGPRMGEIGYGTGLMVSAHPKLGMVINHSGGLPGYGSNMRWVTDSGFGVVALANRTYSPMRSLTNEMIERLADRIEVSHHERRWAAEAPLVEAGGSALVNALWSEDPSAALTSLAETGFAMNVLLDLPLAQRLVEAVENRATVGTVGPWVCVPTNATSGVFSAQSASHTVTVSLSLTPQSTPLIQFYEVVVTARP